MSLTRILYAVIDRFTRITTTTRDEQASQNTTAVSKAIVLYRPSRKCSSYPTPSRALSGATLVSLARLPIYHSSTPSNIFYTVFKNLFSSGHIKYTEEVAANYISLDCRILPPPPATGIHPPASTYTTSSTGIIITTTNVHSTVSTATPFAARLPIPATIVPLTHASSNVQTATPIRPPFMLTDDEINIIAFGRANAMPVASSGSNYYSVNPTTPVGAPTDPVFPPGLEMNSVTKSLSGSGLELQWLYGSVTSYAIFGTLGTGAFGRVMHAVDANKVNVAIKVIPKIKQYWRKGGRDMLLREKKVMERVTSVNAAFNVPLLEAFEDDDNVYFVMPLYSSTLYSILATDVLNPEQAKLIAAELVLGLRFLHDAKIMHRDIKSTNILVDSAGHAAIADFGLSWMMDIDDPFFLDSVVTEMVGTPGYYAPEQLRNRDGYTCKVDVWSLGLIFFQMFSGMRYNLFAPNKPHEEILSMEIPFDFIELPDARNLVAQMLDYNYIRRPSSIDLMSHPFFVGIEWENVYKNGYTSSYPPAPLYYESYSRSIAFSQIRYRKEGVEYRESVRFDSNGQLLPNHVAIEQMLAGSPDDFAFNINDVRIAEPPCDWFQSLDATASSDHLAWPVTAETHDFSGPYTPFIPELQWHWSDGDYSNGAFKEPTFMDY